jgi:hypothetical protein
MFLHGGIALAWKSCLQEAQRMETFSVLQESCAQGDLPAVKSVLGTLDAQVSSPRISLSMISPRLLRRELTHETNYRSRFYETLFWPKCSDCD